MAPFLIEVAVESRADSASAPLIAAVRRLVADDASLSFASDPETGQLILKGVDERQLEMAVQSLALDLSAPIRVGSPHVAYRETPGCMADVVHTHKRHGMVHVRLVVEPASRGSGFSFLNRSTLPRDLVGGFERGLAASQEHGVLAGFPVTDFTATLVHGDCDKVASNAPAFEAAARAVLREVLQEADCKILEPIMRLAVTIAKEDEAECLDDLRKRRGEVLAVEREGDRCGIAALVPLANMFGYGPFLRGMIANDGAYTMMFEHYAPVPLSADDDPFAPAAGARA